MSNCEQDKNQQPNFSSSRRGFLRDSSKLAVVGATAALFAAPRVSLARSVHVFGSDTIKIGLVGCGGRGTGAAINAMYTNSGNVELTAMGDVYAGRLENSLSTCQQEHQGKVQVADGQKFVGFDAYQDVLNSDIDMVILATPPGFRPLHFEAAIKAGKHVFMEKPVAVDAPGIRRVLAAGELAKQNGLAVQVGLQRRHERAYRETIAELQNGAIGDFLVSRVYWNGDRPWIRPRQPEQTELDYQLRNWYQFNWICGDHIVEQHIHNLDVANWLMNDYPAVAQGQGGRQVYVGKDTGQIFDHHIVEFTYPNGHKMISQCRHIPDCWNSVSEWVHGTKGSADISGGRIFDADGKEIFKCKEGNGQRGGHQQEQHDMFADLRNGLLPNETEYGAKSTMTAIFGRMATYSGQEIYWDDAIGSKISLADIESMQSLEDPAPVQPDENGNYPVPKIGSDAKEILDWDFRKRRQRG